MILPNDDIKIIASHTSPVLHVFHFDINEPYHFMSLSDNGEIIEWVFEKTFKNIKEIEKCNLQRPSDEILIINKHEIRKLKKGEYIKITSAIQFNNFIAVGYDDGLILIYQIEKQALNKSKQPVGSLHEKIEEENQSDEENQKEKEKEEDKRLTDETKMDELISKIDYYNTFSLYYILLGHSQQIRSLFYVANKKFLVTSSDNCTVKIYDMTNGFSLYHFNLDCMINKIILMEKKKEQNLVLFSDDPYKLIIDITKEPFSFNHYSFKYNNVSHIEKMNNGYYLLGQRSVYQFDNNLEYKGTFTNLIPIDYTLIKMYKDNIILFDAENYVELVSFKGLEEKKPIVDPKNKKAAAKPAKGKNDKKEEDIKQSDQYNIKTEFKVKMGTDEISECFIYDQFGFCSCQDTNIYLIDFELKKSMHYERSNMANEDAASLQLMNSLANVKSKKKKGKNKGKKKKKK
jgi:hypothetical protein